ncbi:hypothetical protein OYE22_14105 [Streptomyces sp. 71268]|uniref:hypothetical protein n=1 Tax=Streptomyces sp. 71268 TaxID=3002640 RepID=UPI0023F95A6E|nr:hypothetical protein [Streptomyces sp. 71268]WEV26207.1 hypothetical protein OYE22_14105 [Streptomyces sp. 71268]
MSGEEHEIEDLQREVASLLLDHVYAPLLEDQHVRGVLPAPAGAPAVRVALGDRNECEPSRLTAYEIPLGAGDELRTSHDVVGLLRAVHTGTHIYPSNRVTSVLGMDLYLVDPAHVEEAPFTTDDWAATFLRCLAHPAQERGAAGLRGFLFKEGGVLRLYLDSDDVPGVIAADVRPGGALTALLAALPSLLGDEWRISDAVEDPHCRYLVDLTDW